MANWHVLIILLPPVVCIAVGAAGQGWPPGQLDERLEASPVAPVSAQHRRSQQLMRPTCGLYFRAQVRLIRWLLDYSSSTAQRRKMSACKLPVLTHVFSEIKVGFEDLAVAVYYNVSIVVGGAEFAIIRLLQ
ncbi:hypothetical protein CFC21_096936 [Triticum aestivum]|uniref:Secreted protein n=4 Tax=Triticum TaxID=4564 RepID=A0A9R0Z6X8_TRITD|nr:hypothetical protein TRIUR3_35358 [Triticum urartu]KAF7094638.1 hypothetical protein CFC21_096936 [Triticum aestivum]VAI72455.1 unnamed protein product [Triticum turgidum subsp. durum]